MPNKAAAEKYLRASQRRRMRNKPIRTVVRHSVRAALEAIDDAGRAESSWDEADSALREAVSALDRAARKGVVHANTAARRKSRLLRHYHAVKDPEREQRPRTRRPEPAIAG